MIKFENDYNEFYTRYKKIMDGSIEDFDKYFEVYEGEKDKWAAKKGELKSNQLTELENKGLENYAKGYGYIAETQLQNFNKKCDTQKHKLGWKLKFDIFGNNWYYQATETSKKLSEGTKQKYTMDFEMMKTENGWQLVK